MHRLTALLNTVGKVMDKVLAKRLLFIADAYGFLPRTHTGGRAAAGCEHAVHLLLEKVHASWQTGEEDVVSLLILDVSGAFDNVSHRRLIHYLRKRRIPTPMVNWINSFLTGRSTCIKLLEGTSERSPTPISPILYLFYNADLLDIAMDEDGLRHGLVIGYIDDTSIMVNGRTTEEITKTLAMLHKRAEKWANQQPRGASQLDI